MNDASPNPDYKPLPEENLNKILDVIEQFDPEDQTLVFDLANRIIRLALKGQHLGPFALTLAGAQMAVDFTAMQEAGESRILTPDSKIIVN